MYYLVVYRFDSETNSFCMVFFYTSILAGILWINWLIVLEIVVLLQL
jgi:hypothetical protein